MLRRALTAACLCLPLPCRAATDLGVPWVGIEVALNIAASRMDVPMPASNGTCEAGRADPCRWTTRDHVAFEASSDGAGHLGRIEATWSGDDHPDGAAAFHDACAAIASLVEPRWSKAQVSAALAKTMVIATPRGSAPERQQTVGGIRLFGDRDARAEPSRPGAAFLQCGALPDF